MPIKDEEKRKKYHKSYHKEWYEKNKDKRLKQINRRKKEIKDFVLNLKLKCSCCPENYSACLEFHHKTPSEKKIMLGDVANQGWSKERILAEVTKCEVLCSNCHRKLHHKH